MLRPSWGHCHGWVKGVVVAPHFVSPLRGWLGLVRALSRGGSGTTCLLPSLFVSEPHEMLHPALPGTVL